MKRTNKILVNAIKDYILQDEDRTEIVSELKRYKKEFRNIPDYNWYRYGNILPYYSQIRNFYEENKVNASSDDIKMCEDFCFHVGKAIDAILEEENAGN